MSFGIKVSKEGSDVKLVSVQDLLIDTQYPILKIAASGSGTLSVSDGSSDSDTIAHNLGYIPKVMVYGQTYSANGGIKNSRYFRYPYLESSVGQYYSEFTYSLTTSNLVVSGAFFDETSNSDTFDYFYYIYYDEE